jgi:hypothetical protein
MASSKPKRPPVDFQASQALENDPIDGDADDKFSIAVRALKPHLQPGNLKVGKKPPKRKKPDLKKLSQESSIFVKALRRVREFFSREGVNLHYGPGPHKSGSSQDVHGKKGRRGVSSPKALAKAKVDEAQKIEPAITKIIKAKAEELGGELVGLENRLKSEESMARKIKNDAEKEGVSYEERAATITDAVRYTVIYDPDEFVEKAKATQAALEAEGWQQYDHKYRNYFKPGNAYQGYNTVMEHKETGMLFELQYHTPETILIKARNHKIYEEFRNLKENDPKAVSLWNQMIENWKQYQRPKDWQALPGVVL